MRNVRKADREGSRVALGLAKNPHVEMESLPQAMRRTVPGWLAFALDKLLYHSTISEGRYKGSIPLPKQLAESIPDPPLGEINRLAGLKKELLDFPEEKKALVECAEKKLTPKVEDVDSGTAAYLLLLEIRRYLEARAVNEVLGE